MKVVIAHNRYSSAQPSGENAVVDSDIAELGAAGVEVVPFLRSSDDLLARSPARRVLSAGSPVYARSAQRELRDLLRRHRPDLVHLHNPYPLLSPWIVRTAQACGVPVVATVHNYRQACVNGVFFRDGQVCTHCAGLVLAVPAVLHACYRGSRAQSAVMAGALAAHRGTWRRVNRFLAPTDALAAHLRSVGVPTGRITVKPNCAPDPGPPAPLGDGFLFLGRLVPEKGLPLLLDAFARHPVGALGPLRIGGDGPLRHLALATAAARSDVEYLGPLDSVSEAISSSAVVVVPSLWHDVLPTVVLEALAAGRPVLGSTLGGIPYAIGPAGWVVPPSVDALAAALPMARAGAAAAAPVARRRYLDAFHPTVVTAQLLAAYGAVLPPQS